MIKPLKTSSPPHKTFFLSDLHYGHDKEFILEPRGFKTVSEHDDTLADRWNAVCDNESEVFHLGDLMIRADETAFWSLMRRLRFKTLYCLLGNHNAGQKAAYQTALKTQYPDVALRGAEVYPLTICIDGDPGKQVTFLPEYVEVSVGGQHVVLCHYALASWHHMGRGVPMLAGHSHGSLRPHVNRRRDVGIEAYGRPVTLAYLLKAMEDEKPAVVDHHGKSDEVRAS